MNLSQSIPGGWLLWLCFVLMETLISHNEADISTWLPREYEENLSYGQKNAEWSEWTKRLREIIKQDSIDKISKKSQ